MKARTLGAVLLAVCIPSLLAQSTSSRATQSRNMLIGAKRIRPVQDTEQTTSDHWIYADGIEATEQSPKTTRLTWDAYPVDPCAERATYDVYRGKSENFDPSQGTLIARGLAGRTFLSHDPSDYDYFYLVTVHLTPALCELHSGRVEAFPLDLGNQYSVSAGTLKDTCTAQSTTEVWCPTLKQMFHAVISEQSGHEFLIGCEDGDFNGGAWNCVDLRTGYYYVAVHSSTLTVYNAGWVRANLKTGKPFAAIVPVYSILARLK